MSGRHRTDRRPERSTAATATALPVAGGARLALRQVRTDPWMSLLLALLVAVVTCLATLWPRVAEDISTRQVGYVVAQLSPLQRDLTSSTSATLFLPRGATSLDYPDAASTWRVYTTALEDLRAEQPEPLRSALGSAELIVDVGASVPAEPPHPDSDLASLVVQPRVDPFLEQYARLVEGSWPRVTFSSLPEQGGGPGNASTDIHTPEVVLDRASAERLRWTVGQEYEGLLLVGTIEPIDPADPHWAHSPGHALSVYFDGDTGNEGSVAAYLASANPGTLGDPTRDVLSLWYPLSGQGIRADQVEQLARQLNGAASKPATLADGGQAPVPGTRTQFIETQDVEAKFDTGTLPALASLAEAQRATDSVLAVVATGPLGVMAATAVLGAGLVVLRRRPGLALLTARGGSRLQIRAVLAVEGLLLGIPAAALGYLVATLIRPVSTGSAELVVAALIGLLPAVALVLTSGPRSLRATRSDLGLWSLSTARWVAEVLLIAVAVVATRGLLARGLSGARLDSGAAGGPPPAGGARPAVDWLLAATPVLLALAACLVTLRLYPIPVAALTAALRRRRSLTPFLGAARSVRDTAGGMLPALAVILGVSVAVLSSVLVSTVTSGGERAAWNVTGADIRLSGPPVDQAMLERIAAVDGVEHVGTISKADVNRNLVVGQERLWVSVYLVDPGVPAVQAGSPLIDAAPAGLFSATSPTIVTGGRDLTAESGTATLSAVGDVRIAQRLPQLAGIRTPNAYVAMTTTAWRAAGNELPTPILALISVSDPTQTAEVAQRIRAAVPSSLVQTPQAQLETLRSAPAISGLIMMFGAAMVVSTGLTVLAIVLVQLMGAPARSRLLAVLRTLGLDRRQGRALTAWELAPLLAMAFVVGAVVGLVVPWLLLQTVDLSAMTGGTTQPALAVELPVIGAVLLGIMGVVVIGVGLSAFIASRSDLARQLRIGDDR